MNIIRKTIGQLFGTAKEHSTMEQVSASVVAAAAEVDTTDTTDEPTEETPAEEEAKPTEPAAPAEAPVATAVATAPLAAAQVETMVQITATELLRLQAGANSYDAIKAEHAQLKLWHTNAQSGIGLGPDANTATEGKVKHVSAATKRAIEIAEKNGLYEQ